MRRASKSLHRTVAWWRTIAITKLPIFLLEAAFFLSEVPYKSRPSYFFFQAINLVHLAWSQGLVLWIKLVPCKKRLNSFFQKFDGSMAFNLKASDSLLHIFLVIKPLLQACFRGWETALNCKIRYVEETLKESVVLPVSLWLKRQNASVFQLSNWDNSYPKTYYHQWHH